ncbi:MAG: MBOAT family O-acyltransferase, partial [Planctomycetota bacterium]
LLGCSLAFYGYWDYRYLGLLLLCGVSTHAAALALQHVAKHALARAGVLAAMLSLNLGILFLFKYWGLFSSTVIAWGGDVPGTLQLLLPIGISFYTFQSIGYVVDVYRRKVVAEPSLPRTILFIAYFPQLIAGPIERAGRLLPRLRMPIRFRMQDLRRGAWLALWGLFKKIVIADRLGIYVDEVYDNPDAASAGMLWAATYAFAHQIYCDFSGYSDMAIGVSRMFGIDLMRNFRMPYLAIGFRDFWARWHISLSTWFRDYVYIPLGGNRCGSVRWIVNLLLVFTVSGLWHGARWTFVLWGLLHGVLVVGELMLGWWMDRMASNDAANRSVPSNAQPGDQDL